MRNTRGRTPKGRGFAAALILALMGATVVGAPSKADAQAWTESREDFNGSGLRAGRFRLHPGVGVEFGYDNNIFFEETGANSAGIMRLTAHLNWVPAEDGDGEATRNIDFRGGFHGSLLNYFGESRYNATAGADFNLHIRPQAPVSFRLANSFQRSIQPFVDASTRLRYARDVNTTTAAVHFRSQSGTLQAMLGYALMIDHFEDRVFDYAGAFRHTILSRATWAFFPNTGLVYDGQVTRVNVNGGMGSGARVSDGFVLRQELGLNGALSEAVSATAMVGYSAGLFSDPLVDDYESVTARVEVRLRPIDQLNVKLGYQRIFNPSSIGNFARHDRLHLGATLAIGTRVSVGGNFAAIRSVTGTALDISGDTLDVNRGRRRAWRLQTQLFGEVRILSWLAANLTLRHISDITDYTFDRMGMVPVTDPAASFSKFQVWLGVRAFY